MYKELADDIDGFKVPSHGYLRGWAKQGDYQIKSPKFSCEIME